MKVICFVLFLYVNIVCFGGGAPEYILNEKYSRNISKITQYFRLNQNYPVQVKTKQIFELRNRIYILTENISGNHEDTVYHYLCYNINPNNEEIRLLDLSYIVDFDYDINYYDNYIEILTNRRKITSYGLYETEAIKLVFEFDENNNLKSYKKLIQKSGNIEEEYEYYYDGNGLLYEVYSIHEWGKTLRKKLYYDGIFREFELPCFENIRQENVDQIIIFENGRLKYYSKRAERSFIEPPSENLNEDQARAAGGTYTVCMFNENGIEFSSITYSYRYDPRERALFEYGDRMLFEKENILYDDNNNFLYARVNSVRIRRDSGGRDMYFYGEYRREIEYK
jgi:hypothetical protein